VLGCLRRRAVHTDDSSVLQGCQRGVCRLLGLPEGIFVGLLYQCSIALVGVGRPNEELGERSQNCSFLARALSVCYRYVSVRLRGNAERVDDCAGTKCDRRGSSTSEVGEWCQEQNLCHFEVSSKTGEGLNELISTVVSDFRKKRGLPDQL
jgi:hypothetical protein